MKTLLISALALALAVPAAATAAAPSDTAVAIKVRHGDLDLAQARDAAVMVRRLDRAAAAACGASHFSLREVQAAVRSSGCYQDSMNKAIAELGSPTVNAIYRDRGLSVAAN